MCTYNTSISCVHGHWAFSFVGIFFLFYTTTHRWFECVTADWVIRLYWWMFARLRNDWQTVRQCIPHTKYLSYLCMWAMRLIVREAFRYNVRLYAIYTRIEAKTRWRCCCCCCSCSSVIYVYLIFIDFFCFGLSFVLSNSYLSWQDFQSNSKWNWIWPCIGKRSMEYFSLILDRHFIQFRRLNIINIGNIQSIPQHSLN